ncbi:MAG: DUF2442 domain-containing protein [Spirochaetales bacterium]|nr:DUF2442 domain-containing protein [Spirochaetales bacterium]
MKFVFHKVKSIGVFEPCVLIAQFEDGVFKTYDIRQLTGKYPVFRILEDDPVFFRKVKIDGSGFGIVWNDELDLSCNELWENGRSLKTPFDNLIGLSDATEIWKLNESTLRKAISYGKLRIGRDVCNYGKQWVVTKAAMIREYGYPEQDYSGFQAVAEEVPKYGK